MNLLKNYFALSICISCIAHGAAQASTTTVITPRVKYGHLNISHEALHYQQLQRFAATVETIQLLTPDNVNQPGTYGQFDYALEFMTWSYQQSIANQQSDPAAQQASEKYLNIIEKLLDLGATSKNCKKTLTEIATQSDNNRLLEKISRNN